MIDTWKSTKYRSFLLLSIKVEGNQIDGLAAPTAEGDQNQLIKNLIRAEMVAALAVVLNVEQFNAFSVPFAQKLEFFAQHSGHMQHGTGKHGVCPGGMGPLHLGAFLSRAV